MQQASLDAVAVLDITRTLDTFERCIAVARCRVTRARVMFADQHLESLGGAQVSMRLQKRSSSAPATSSRSSLRACTVRIRRSGLPRPAVDRDHARP